MHVIAHGGAGSSPDDPETRQGVLRDSVDAGAGSETPSEAVCRVVRRLESAPGFNAGVGSAVQSDGRIRTDASLMTDDGTAGAACAMPDVEHAVDVARSVATETPHVLLAGQEAVTFAEEMGVETDRDLWTERTRERWEDAEPPGGDTGEQLAWVRERFGASHDTVGAVATDGDGLAAATSTGGRWFALAGRVGDVPQLGAGVYAGATGAASATGDGEDIARFGLAREAVAGLETFSPRQAAEQALSAFEDETGGDAGVIVLDENGHYGSAFNTATMQTARD